MANLRIIRDKITKEVKTMATGDAVVMECGSNDEYIELEDTTHDEVLGSARKSAGIRPEEILGKFHIYDDSRIEGSAAVIVPKPTIAGEIRKARAKNKKTPDAPITLEEIEVAERALNAR